MNINRRTLLQAIFGVSLGAVASIKPSTNMPRSNAASIRSEHYQKLIHLGAFSANDIRKLEGSL